MEHELKEIIKKCDDAMRQEDFDTLMNYYTDDALLVIKPDMIAKGKNEIKTAFIKIAEYFNHSLVSTQGEMIVLEAGDTALVISQTLLEADQDDSGYLTDRRATYVFQKNEQGEWRCAIDNWYGTNLLDK